jgi:hypothetical protein
MSLLGKGGYYAAGVPRVRRKRHILKTMRVIEQVLSTYTVEWAVVFS